MSGDRRQQALLGRWGEAKAAGWLRQNGYTLLSSGWHCRFGEIDLIAEKGRYLCFVEVKTRRSEDFALPREAVTPAKQRKLCASAQMYLTEHPSQKFVRFDVAEVYAPEGTATKQPRIVYLEAAFEPPER